MTTALLLLYYKGDGFPEMMLKTIKEKEEVLWIAHSGHFLNWQFHLKREQIAQCGACLVARISKLTKSAKRISGANVTNLFQAFCSVPNNTMPLSFKNQNTNNQCFKMRYCESFRENWRNLPKTGGRKLHGLKRICYICTRYPLGILRQFWHPSFT